MNCFCCRDYFITRSVRLSIADIFGDRTRKYPCFLQNHSETAAETVTGDIHDISARNTDFSAVDIVKPQQKVDYSRFSASCRPNDSDTLSRIDAEREIFYQADFRII